LLVLQSGPKYTNPILDCKRYEVPTQLF
jgi:hypothetical protein